MLIAQISDPHVVAPGRKTCGVAPTAENLARCVASINALVPRPDLVLVSGDLTHGATREQAEHAASLLDGLARPYRVVPGNHDDRVVLGEVFGDKAGVQVDGFVCHVTEAGPVRIIGLDSVDSGRAGGAFCPKRLAWLRDCLEEGGDAPTLLFMHHPPLKLGVPETDVDGFRGAAELGELVAAWPNIERILCGHIHLPTHSRWRGTIVTTAPSTAMDLDLDLTQPEHSRFRLSEPAYLLHHRLAGGTIVTHSVRLSGAAGPYDFSG